MNIELIQGDILEKTCDLLVVSMFKGAKSVSDTTEAVDKGLEGVITELIAQREFEGKLGESLVFPAFGWINARNVALLGLGDKKKFNEDTVRQIGGHIVKVAREQKAKSMTTFLHGAGEGGLNPRVSAQALTEGLLLGAHTFHAYKGTQHKKNKQPSELSEVFIFEKYKRAAKMGLEGVKRGKVLSEATILARDLVNTPSADMTPERMAEEAKALVVRGSGISCKILDQAAIEHMGMHATLSVARGSRNAPVGVHLVYRPAKSKKTVAIVGKGVTFDSGGLSIKPANGMETMKIDMAGAASVIGLFKALADLKPKVTVHGIFLAVENMPGGNAFRPGDVVRAMDGTTIEIKSTDAEGRVVLADSLCYAKKQKPDMIVDLATLTGAVVIALGEEIAGLLTNDEKLGQKLLTAAKETGEGLWELPLHRPYMKAVRSKIADINNTGGRDGGVIKGALFLTPFVEDTPWAHIDIGGTCYTEKETRPDQPHGATGYGVRMLAKFLMSL
ncbi:MAG: leucyl aminopeptidase [Patescibacteria group bacterium]